MLSLRMTDIGGKEVGPYRVWLGEAQLLGLAMSRSLGDTLAHSIGVSPKPEVSDHIAGNEAGISISKCYQ